MFHVRHNLGGHFSLTSLRQKKKKSTDDDTVQSKRSPSLEILLCSSLYEAEEISEVENIQRSFVSAIIQ